MSGDIVLWAGVRSNLLPLQCAADLMTQARQRLSSGKKVNSAIENPTNFFTAASFNNRAGDLGSDQDLRAMPADQPCRDSEGCGRTRRQLDLDARRPSATGST